MLATTCQMPVDMSDAQGDCLWVDTESTFRSERLVTIAQRYDSLAVLWPKRAL